MRPLFFRVLASTQTGAGHLMRSLALAQAAESYDVPSVFLLDAEAKSVAAKRHDWHYKIIDLPSGLADDEEGNWIGAQAKEQGAAAIIFDGYTFAADTIKASRSGHCTLVLMDDGMTHVSQFVDIVVDPAASPKTDSAQQRFCYGPEFRLLRREFAEVSPNPISQRNGIAISLGGSDPKNLTIPLLEAIAKRMPNLPIRVVTGPAYQRLSELEACIATLLNPIQHIHNCQDMSEVWNHAKLAISAAGGSQFELGTCATPSILLIVADNQQEATKQAVKEGWAHSFDCVDRTPLADIANCVQSLLDNDLQVLSDKAKGLYDAEGATRLLKIIAEHQQ
ncbi:UDP-2,4-diacetamido-2,4,6-trideoxy-beta-L-altropyranose hydrolase [Alteromonas ponticola]|uniref:UDP-2,4-diacetamido-2,4, 6-trideoxy-beta-L-altropyranose hydrolase n=1 Tax=Alteromonas aquimaris TaxID=2998417 RepID=A0ABT3P4A7_9ALTE|nr:UDP-2,4-diacetamido-2,4,6-trideoxy-beta-L-altropyranose hydrolase [Alteromonas aquimaris]MCW8107602.1 UDP-2,4-diacetamido-2,4,6-trideoxy-beta-L-altropyranose hydrolase [Alteromonas aquimaris]